MTHRLAVFALATFILTICVYPVQAQQLEAAAQDLANDISQSLVTAERNKIAILPFTTIAGEHTILGQLFAEELLNKLFMLRRDRFDIIERSKIDEIWNEQEKAASGWYQSKLSGFSEILGADAILVGSIADLGEYFRINSRLISVPSGELLATASTFMLPTGIPNDPVPQRPRDPARPKPPQSVTVSGITFDLLSCTKEIRMIRCKFLVTNNDADRKISIRVDGTILYDQEGRSFNTTSMRMANNENNSAYLHGFLIAEVPTKLSIDFSGIPSTIEFVRILNINTLSGVQFRDVRFSK